MIALRRLLSCLLATVLLPGCFGSGQSGNATISASSLDWPYAPTSIQVHPISRIKIDRETGRAVVHARVEFLDSDGFSTRGIGELDLILSGQSDDGVMLMSQTEWTCDLNDADKNRQYYDEVTRTYQAMLEMEPDMNVPWEPNLRAVLLLPDGRSLTDSRRIRIARTTVEPKTDPIPDQP
ncbi:MAG: hypothetical protein CMJ24_11955 [Phycisphaerae bacterium]|nr:hypothetical protein [Phycisphaerae bacterium]|tara:strand:- start:2111 stop:2650 length:540 start_codon:yes stop_codon:yes gene_type:complete